MRMTQNRLPVPRPVGYVAIVVALVLLWALLPIRPTDAQESPAPDEPASTATRVPSVAPARPRLDIAEMPATARGGDIIPGRYIVTLTPGADVDAVVRKARQMGSHNERRFGRALNGFALRLPAQAAARLQRDPRIARLEPDRVVTVAAPTQRPAPWGLDRVDQRDLPLSGDYVYDANGRGVTAYIVDTGIRSTHSDFGGRVAAGFDAVGGGTEDCQGHGTHVAGSVGGNAHGVAKAVRLVPVRVLDCDGIGSSSGVIAGIDWIVRQRSAGAPAVANLSLGGGASAALDDAVRRAISSGISVVVAAGNSNVDACTASPARVPEALTVGATDNADRRGSFSNFGSCLDLFAPGVQIPSTWHTSDAATAVLSGTSMAAPHVTGAVALLLETRPSRPPAGVAKALLADATTGVVGAAGAGSPDLLLFTRDTTPPRPVGALAAAAGRGQVALSWTNPTDTDLAAVAVRRVAGTTPPASATSGVEVSGSLARAATATGLRPGTDYSFSVFAVDRAGNASAARSLTARGSALRLESSTGTVTHPTSVTFGGHLSEAATGTALAGRTARLLVRPRGTTSWTRAATVTTSSRGAISTNHRPGRNVDYTVRFPGAGTHLGAGSPVVAVNVRQSVSATLRTAGLSLGSSVRLNGSAGPAHAGETVRLQRRVGGVWRDVATATLSSTSTFSFSIRPTTRGTFVYRVRRPADADHARGTSRAQTLSVS